MLGRRARIALTIRSAFSSLLHDLSDWRRAPEQVRQTFVGIIMPSTNRHASRAGWTSVQRRGKKRPKDDEAQIIRMGRPGGLPELHTRTAPRNQLPRDATERSGAK